MALVWLGEQTGVAGGKIAVGEWLERTGPVADMGADINIAHCPAPKVVVGDDVGLSEGHLAARAEIRRRVSALSDKALLDAAEMIGWELADLVTAALDGDDISDDEYDATTARAVRDLLCSEDAIEALFEARRDVTSITVGGQKVLITGGMSYGDEPTDAFDAIALYAETGVTVEPIRLGEAAERPLRIEVGGPGIVVTLGPTRHETPGAYEGGTIESELHEPDESSELKVALDTLEALVLAHAVAGIDVSSPAYVEGVETVVDAIGNRVG